MKNFITPFFLLITLSSQAQADCRDIVSRTVAELRAGASEWNEDMERIARAAAGSACVKAGGDGARVQGVDAAISEQAVRPEGKEDGASGAAAARADGDDDEDWHPLKGFKFNPVTGSPGKKPYERRREVNETEVEREAGRDDEESEE